MASGIGGIHALQSGLLYWRYTRSTEWPVLLEVYTLYRVASVIGGIHALQSGIWYFEVYTLYRVASSIGGRHTLQSGL